MEHRVADGRMFEIDQKPASIFRQKSYARFWLARAFSTLTFQMSAVAVGWQIYEITHSTFALGMVGLVQFLPILLLTLLVGHVADRFNRKAVMTACQVVSGVMYAALAAGSYFHFLSTGWIYFAVAIIGTARAFERPSTQALLPSLVESPRVPQAIAWSSSSTQTASIIGPALGGVLYALGAHVPYGLCAGLCWIAAILSMNVQPLRNTRHQHTVRSESLFSGIQYVFERKKILGAISLDLFVVLLGGATALLPAYARDILHAGPWGLGLLRVAPAVGALSVSVFLAHRPIRRRAGYCMFSAVIVFGVATVLFGLSRNFLLSMGILCLLGAADLISVVVRSSLVQLETPDRMRGRVSAVNSLFIGTSNQLGQFESGVTAAWWGVVPATIIGGIGSICIAALWIWWFPGLRQLDSVSSMPAEEHVPIPL